MSFKDKFKEKGKKKRKKKEIAYVYDAKAMVNAGIISLAFVLLMVPIISAFKPKESFNVGYQENKYKKLTMAAVSTILMDGLSGFFRMSRDVGGLESGKLGNVSTIRLDYQTDLVVQLTPYTNAPSTCTSPELLVSSIISANILQKSSCSSSGSVA